jgi:putative glutamine amidotransferase
MSVPLIAIPTYHLGPGRVGDWAGAYALPEAYVTALRRAGARPVLLPSAEPADAADLLEPFHGLLLAGGGDVDPARYGAPAHPAQYGTDPDRDAVELALALAADRLGKPVLGICRGVQLLNVAFGGTLLQHLPELTGLLRHRADGEQLRHPLRVLAGSRLAGALGGEQVEGLSHHHQGLDRLGDGFQAVAWSPDGLVEGIERERGWTVGVLWHPEGTAAADPAQHRLLRSFVAEASRRGLRFWNPGAEPVGSRGPGPGS